MRKFRNRKDVSGGLFLELLFMIAILLVVFPLIYNNIAERTEEIRNKMVVKDMMRIKLALENYLQRSPDELIPSSGVSSLIVDIALDDLLEDGLPSTSNRESILGHEYKARVKITVDDAGVISYDAIVLALDKDEDSSISDLRIKSIVKQAKGFAGYVDTSDKLIYAPNWQMNLSEWNSNNSLDVIDDKSIVVKTGFAKKDYEYISRLSGVGNATMLTDLYMSLRSINNVRNLYVNEGVETQVYNASGTNNLGSVAVEEKLNLKYNVNISKYINFPSGFSAADYFIRDENAKNLYLENLFTIAGNLSFVSEDTINSLRYIETNNLQISDTEFLPTVMQIGNSLVAPFVADNFIFPKNVKVETYNNNKNVSGGVALNVDSIESSRSSSYKLASSGFSGHDLVIRNVNKKLLLYNTRIGGIAITETTPISVILRALHYAHADVYRILTNSYPSSADMLVEGWYYNLYLRCEYNECTSTGWYY